MPEFTVNSERSGRVLHSFSGLSPHHEIVLEPSEWRDAEESDDGRSLVLWASRTPGVTLSMHRRPDGTFSGVFGGKQDIFEAVDRGAAENVAASQRKAPRDDVDAVSRASGTVQLQGSSTDSVTADQAVVQAWIAAWRKKTEVRAWIKAWRIMQQHNSRGDEQGAAELRRSSKVDDITSRKAEVQAWVKAWRSNIHQSKAVQLSAVDKERTQLYKKVLSTAFSGLPQDWVESIAQQVCCLNLLPPV